MKILKIAGIVAGIHAFLLILIFAIPGCNSTTRPPPQPADTMTSSAPTPLITVPNMSSGSAVAAAPAADASAPALTPPPAGFNPDAPATYGDPASSGGVHFTPTRPNSPAASVLMTQPVSDVTPAASYAVKSGDSLWSIAKRNHISVSELAAANGLKTGAVLHQDQKLIIPGKSGRAASSKTAATAATAKASTEIAVPAKANGEELKHTVKPGETLGVIARKYGVKVREIEVRNNITDPGKVRVGSELIIPGWKSTGSRSGKAAASSESAPRSTPTSTPEAAPAPAASPSMPDQSQPTPTTSIPVIHLDDNPLTPAPKS